MFWVYRAIKNPIAKRKWLAFCTIFSIVGIAMFLYKYIHGSEYAFLGLCVFIPSVFMYTIITLGKPRYYYLNDEIIYKPFKTPLLNVEGFEVDYDNKVIRLKLKRPSIFAVKTLYFESDEDLEEVARHLRLKIQA